MDLRKTVVLIDGVKYVVKEALGIQDEEWLDEATVIQPPNRTFVRQATIWKLRLKGCVEEPAGFDPEKVSKRILEKLKLEWAKLNGFGEEDFLGSSSGKESSPS